MQMAEQNLNLVSRQNVRKSQGPFCPHDSIQPAQLLAEYLFVQEEQSAARLILSRGAHTPLLGQMRQEALDLRLCHLARMALAVEQDEADDPPHVGFLGPAAVMAGMERLPDLVQKAKARWSDGSGFVGFDHRFS